MGLASPLGGDGEVEAIVSDVTQHHRVALQLHGEVPFPDPGVAKRRSPRHILLHMDANGLNWSDEHVAQTLHYRGQMTGARHAVLSGDRQIYLCLSRLKPLLQWTTARTA